MQSSKATISIMKSSAQISKVRSGSAEIKTIGTKTETKNVIESAKYNMYDGTRNPSYSGSTEVIPGDTEQVLATAGKNLNSNIVVKPIPSNYGKIITIGNIIRIV